MKTALSVCSEMTTNPVYGKRIYSCFQNPLFLFFFNVGPYVQVLTITTVYSEKILLELHLSTITIVCDLGQIYILLILP